jgi:GST-like protein
MVEAAFALAEQPVDLIEASRWSDAGALAELERVNPLGQVPTLVWPDGTMQTESIAILIELALRFPDAALLPAEPSARAVALRWLAYLSGNIYAAYNPRDFPERWIDDPVQHAALVDGASRRIKQGWEVMAAQFQPRGVVAFGDRPGALDVAICVMSRWSPRRDWFDFACPGLAALAHAADDHPMLRPVWSANFD